jgi:hypothetical protein
LDNFKTAVGIRKIPLNNRLLKYLLPLKGPDEEFIVNNKWLHWKAPMMPLAAFSGKPGEPWASRQMSLLTHLGMVLAVILGATRQSM